MNTQDILAILGIVVIGIVVLTRSYVSTKKERQEEEKNKELNIALAEALNKSKQHLQYKKPMKLLLLIRLAKSLFFALTLVLLFFSPIFLSKTELLGVTVEEHSFSAYESFMILKSVWKQKEQNIFADANYDLLLITLIFISAYLVIVGLSIIGRLIAIFNGDEYAFDTFKEMRTCKSQNFGGDLSDFAFGCIIECAIIGLQIFTVFNCKNAEFKLESDFPIIIKDLGNQYLGYYNVDGDLLFKVFQNDFVFCNGVSGYIAFPIIFFVIAVVLCALNIYLKKKLIREIKNEIIELPEQEQKENQS